MRIKFQKQIKKSKRYGFKQGRVYQLSNRSNLRPFFLLFAGSKSGVCTHFFCTLRCLIFWHFEWTFSNFLSRLFVNFFVFSWAFSVLILVFSWLQICKVLSAPRKWGKSEEDSQAFLLFLFSFFLNNYHKPPKYN